MNEKHKLRPDKSKLPALVVIDDEESILMSLRRLFRKDNYNMHFFTSPLKALEFLNNNNADVIITDMRMPEMSGSEFLLRSKEISPDAIKVIVSGYEEKSIILDAISYGLARHYIMKPWDDEQLRLIVSESMSFQQKLRQRRIQEVLLSFQNLPSPPVLHARLKEILRKDIQSQREISIEIEKSPNLVAKLLRMANSVFYGLRKPISNIFDALTFIGTEAVLSLVLSLESFELLSANASPEVMRIAEEIRIKSVMRAQVARKISVQWEEKVNPQEVYVAALLLDIGLVFRFCSSSKEKFQEFISVYFKGGKSLFNVDREIFSVTHDEVGEALLTYWNFSPTIISAVANHHCYLSSDPLITIVQIADLLVQGYDSYPHDPLIDKYAEEWKIKLKYILDGFKDVDLFADNPGAFTYLHETS
jgi:HD-like signal output (HDOD) protein